MSIKCAKYGPTLYCLIPAHSLHQIHFKSTKMRLFQQTTTSHIALDPDFVNFGLFAAFCITAVVVHVFLKMFNWSQPHHRSQSQPNHAPARFHPIHVPQDGHVDNNNPGGNNIPQNYIQHLENEIAANPNQNPNPNSSPVRRQPARQPARQGRRAPARRAAAGRRNEEEQDDENAGRNDAQPEPEDRPRQAARWSLQMSMSFPMM